MPTLTGGCYCHAIRYEISGAPFFETICHCAICRGTTGAPMVAWFSINHPEFRITAGTPKRFRSSDDATRSFCGECGTQLTFVSDKFPDYIDVTTATLDEPARVPPKDHTWARSRIPWVEVEDGLPRFARAREE
jgi:hypothetical protein